MKFFSSIYRRAMHVAGQAAAMPMLAALLLVLCAAAPAWSQPLKIGSKVTVVDSILSKWKVDASTELGDSVCLGARFWDLEGKLQFHIDTAERKLIKVDWCAYLPVERPQVEGIAKELCASLGEASRARNDQWIYWIWDNDEVHYLLGYGKGTLKLQEFEDQTALEACVLQH